MSSTPFHLEFEFETFMKASAPVGRQRRIGGWVTTDQLDKQGEILIQEGLDFAPFLKGGFFNDNHLKQTGKAVGYPEIAELRTRPDGSKGHYVEGYLIEGHAPADEIWSLANALERSGAPRRLGYSVEGTILERDPGDQKTVRKAIVREVAITRCPVNDNTALSVLAKSLSAGAAVGNPGTSPGQGFPLRTESLEAAPKSAPEDDEDDEKLASKKKMKKSEAVRFLMRRNHLLSEMSATRIVEYAMQRDAA
jgi:hypothetical protein